MKLEVGKYYMNGHGHIIPIVGYDEEANLFIAHGSYDYEKDGKVHHENIGGAANLIKEVRVTIEEVEPESEFKKLNGLLSELKSDNMHVSLSADMEKEIERLQKLFEGSEK